MQDPITMSLPFPVRRIQSTPTPVVASRVLDDLLTAEDAAKRDLEIAIARFREAFESPDDPFRRGTVLGRAWDVHGAQRTLRLLQEAIASVRPRHAGARGLSEAEGEHAARNAAPLAVDEISKADPAAAKGLGSASQACIACAP
jgi:hypothetical protein